ncbi:hypothetical protein RclHR1_01240019 [Rhizophagus clarus]|uniref:Hsp70 family protein n=1 Tax=Rhizophagus clarus TaxID=94130 RepID=A0A2Z6QZB0_9GLOM|nr:hypothetical protein RclHR1_01240019 [Rhizophagus clarus]GES97202.1 hypothetical protein GLOIN_2v1785667 [Rhizophagus clarus]
MADKIIIDKLDTLNDKFDIFLKNQNLLEERIEKLQQRVQKLENQQNEMLQSFEDDEEYVESESYTDIFQNIGSPEETDENLKLEESDIYTNIQAVVGIDFGTITTGFSCCDVSDEKNICFYNSWPNWFTTNRKLMKIDTALHYNNNYEYVNFYNKRNRIVELFKLYLGDSPDNLKPKLPVNYKRAITDYIKEIGQCIKEEVKNRWVSIDFFENVLLVLTVPEDYTEKDKDIMRECVYNANLIQNKSSNRLRFITESEAAALYCMKNKLQEYDLLTTEKSFMIVDCGGCTVDLATFKLIGDNPPKLSKVTERTRDFCGSSSIDKEFIKFLREKIETRAINLLMETKNEEFQILIQSFREQVKEGFDGNNMEHCIIYVPRYTPSLSQYVSKKTRKSMEEVNWTIRVEQEDIKKMFDPTIDRIIRLLHIQLSNNEETCSAMFLVGGLSENKYLQNRIKEEFHNVVKIISVTDQPMCAMQNGAVIYGLSKLENHENNVSNNSSRVLNYTYGIQFSSDWTKDVDTPNSKISDRETYKFNPLVRQGTEVTPDQTFSLDFKPESGKSHVKFGIYYTNKVSATYIDEPKMKLMGILNADLPDAHLDNRNINFGLTFGSKEITAFARNEINGQKFVTTFCYPIDDDF